MPLFAIILFLGVALVVIKLKNKPFYFTALVFLGIAFIISIADMIFQHAYSLSEIMAGLACFVWLPVMILLGILRVDKIRRNDIAVIIFVPFACALSLMFGVQIWVWLGYPL